EILDVQKHTRSKQHALPKEINPRIYTFTKCPTGSKPQKPPLVIRVAFTEAQTKGTTHPTTKTHNGNAPLIESRIQL
ncbi:MAG: hypothetical protein AAGB46_12385, partial [Verrucomicrobiota bacterium]